MRIELKHIIIVMAIIGLFYAVLPHSIHIASGIGFGLSHEVHITYGIILLALAFVLYKEKINLGNREFLKLLAIMLVGTLILDYIWHHFFTVETISRATNIFYWLTKIWIIFYLAVRIFNRHKELKTKDILKYSLVFTLILSVYYRFYELLGNIPLGRIAGNIHLDSIIITPENTIMFALAWLIAHSLVVSIPLFIWRRFR